MPIDFQTAARLKLVVISLDGADVVETFLDENGALAWSSALRLTGPRG